MPTTDELYKELAPGQVPANPPTSEVSFLEEPKVAEPLVTNAQVQTAQAVRTTVKRNEEGNIEITCSHPVPDFETVKAHLEPAYQKKLKKHAYWSLQNHINNTAEVIPFQVWSDAISSAIMVRLANEEGATTELQHVAQGGYLALGTTLYKLSAVEQLPQTKALATARKKIRDVAEQEAKTLMESTRASVNALLANANRVRQEAQQLKELAEREMGQIPPRWMRDTGYPLRYQTYNNSWGIQLAITFRITHFDIHFNNGEREATFSWEAIPIPSRTIRLWIPTDQEGKYQATSISVDQSDPELPHINHQSSCMSLASGPKQLRNNRDLANLRTALEDCHRRVQLDSLYTGFATWNETFKGAVPKDLLAAIKLDERYMKGVHQLATKLGKTEKTEIEVEEANTTWSA